MIADERQTVTFIFSKIPRPLKKAVTFEIGDNFQQYAPWLTSNHVYVSLFSPEQTRPNSLSNDQILVCLLLRLTVLSWQRARLSDAVDSIQNIFSRVILFLLITT